MGKNTELIRITEIILYSTYLSTDDCLILDYNYNVSVRNLIVKSMKISPMCNTALSYLTQK